MTVVKIYMIKEGDLIRGVFTNEVLAQYISKMFYYLNLIVIEVEMLSDDEYSLNTVVEY